MNAADIKAACTSRFPGVNFEWTASNVGLNGDHPHTHTIAALTRRFHGIDTCKRALRRWPGAGFCLPGGSTREVKILLDLDVPASRIHVCSSGAAAHDSTHEATSSCQCDSCAHPSDIIVATDFIYYKNHHQIADYIQRHGARALIGDINLPYVGDSGQRYEGETTWTRVSDDHVKVVTDPYTLEQWEHSDMTWLLTDTCLDTRHGHLAWSVFSSNAERVSYVFTLHPKPVVNQGLKLHSLETYLKGGPAPASTHAGAPVLFRTSRVWDAFDVPSRGVPDGYVCVGDIEGIRRWLSRQRGAVKSWETLAASRADTIIGKKTPKDGRNIAATAAAAVQMAMRDARAVGYIDMDSKASATAAKRHHGQFKPKHWLTRLITAPIGLAMMLLRASRNRNGHEHTPTRVEYPINVVAPATCVALRAGLTTPRGSVSAVEHECSCGESDTSHACFGLAGIGIKGAPVYSCCLCAGNAARAAQMRILDLGPNDDADVDHRTWVTASQELPRLMGIPGRVHPRTMDFESWVTRPAMKTAARAKLRAANQLGRTYDSAGEPVYKSVQCFVKCEPMVRDITTKPAKPRIIRPVDDALRVDSGPAIFAATQIIKQVFSRSLLYCSGRKLEEISTWFDEAINAVDNPAFILSDMSNMDGTNTLTRGQLIAYAALRLVGMPDHITERHIRYKTDGTTFYGGSRGREFRTVIRELDQSLYSGDDGTTVFNTILVLITHAKTIEELYGALNKMPGSVKRLDLVGDTPSGAFQFFRTTPWHERDAGATSGPMGRRWRAVQNLQDERMPLCDFTSMPAFAADTPAKAAANGDDSFVVVEDEDALRYAEAFKRAARGYGLNADVEVVSEPILLEFCSNIPYPIGAGKHMFGPKIGRIIAKTGYKRLARKDAWLGMVRGDALSLQQTVAHIPILRVWVQKLLQLTGNARAYIDPEEEFKMRCEKAHALHEDVWAALSVRYGLSVAQLRELECDIAHVQRLPAVLTNPLWHIIVAKDCGVDSL